MASEKKNIFYRFFKKPLASPLTILQRSAMPESVKVATFTQEILRRLKCTSTGVSQDQTEDILLDFMSELEAMGYPLEWRLKIFRKAMIGYTRILSKAKS